jgi:hypothetical protein
MMTCQADEVITLFGIHQLGAFVDDEFAGPNQHMLTGTELL